ncbi:glycoside hydrolase family 68 protein [Streptococcus salivarius]
MTRKQVIKSLSIAAAILGTSAITQVQADEAQNLTALTDNSTVIATVGASNEVTPEATKEAQLAVSGVQNQPTSEMLSSVNALTSVLTNSQPVSSAAVSDTVSSSTAENQTTPSTDTEPKATSNNQNNGDASAISPEPATISIEKVASNIGKLNDSARALVQDAKLTEQEIADLTEEQINALNNLKTPQNIPSGTKMTYKDFADIAKSLVDQDPRYAVPYFKAAAVQNMQAARTRSAQTNSVTDLDVWDSWAVQNPRTKLVENWNGYQLAVAMMGVPGKNDSHLYLLYNKFGDNSLQNWKNAGSIFGYGLDELDQQWSGSAILNSDGSVQLFYTKVDTRDHGKNHQKIASITLNLGHDSEKVWINSTENDQVIFEGDGYHYQTFDQWNATNRGADNIAMRDAHIVEEEDGSRYLVFEASTGTENYQGAHQIFDLSNYGGDSNFKVKSLLQILKNGDITSRATWANAAIGILKLNGDEKKPKVEKVYSPLITANMVSDEIERPSLVKLDGKYYLFAASRLNRGSNDDAWYAANTAVGDNVVMVGYVSDNLLGGYKPLNNSGVVLTASVPADWRTATYSYYAVPVKDYNDRILVTSYMTNRGEVAGKGNNATWGPSFLVQILPDGKTRVLAKMTEQGDWIWDDSSDSQAMVGDFESSRLPGEDFIVDWELIGYNLKEHSPFKETSPLPNNNPKTSESPKKLEDPKTPEVTYTVDSFDAPSITKDTPVQSAAVLPATGSKNSSVSLVAGMMAIIGSIVTSFVYRGKHRN